VAGPGETRAASGRWTEERVRVAAVAGIVGGVGLTAVAVVHNAVGLDVETVAPEPSAEAASTIAHGVAYPLMLAVLLGVLAVRPDWFGRVSRVAGWTLAASLAVLGVAFLFAGIALLAGAAVDFEAWYLLPAAIGFAVMFLAALVLGIGLLLRRSAWWLPPVLMVATVPAGIVTALLDALDVVSLTAAAVEAPLYLAFAALGCELLTRRPNGSARRATSRPRARRRAASGSSGVP
jgi:hypothetical protein